MVTLSGQLVCSSHDEVELVQRLLPEHVELTRAEPGCLRFDVVRTDDPMVWQVDELFVDQSSFSDHQRRVADSTWGRATGGIERRYGSGFLSVP